MLSLDCRNALRCVMRRCDNSDFHQVLSRITSDLKILVGMKVYTSVVWIPEHAGIYYNEAADFVAKSALKQHSDHPYGSITLSACKSLVALHVEDLWQLKWHRSLTGCVTHSYIPAVGSNITLPRLRCSAISYTRLLLGDTTLNVHMERMGLAESQNCQCGMGIDDEHHFFFECHSILS